MATFNKFNVFARDLSQGKHLFGSHSFKVMLTDVAPVAANALLSDLVEIAAAHGYSAGGSASTMTETYANGIYRVTGTNVVFTASGGAIAQCRYAVLYNVTQTSPLKPLVGWWDYGTELNLASTEALTVAMDQVNGLFSVQ